MEQSPRSESANCLVLDVKLPTINGIELQEHLARSNRQIPIIFITGHADVPMTIQAMKGGAVDFFTKPVDGRAILDAVAAAIDRDRKRRAGESSSRDLAGHLRDPHASGAGGHGPGDVRSHEQAGRRARWGLREITVKIHRGNIMRKMQARSLPDLVRMADALRLIRQET